MAIAQQAGRDSDLAPTKRDMSVKPARMLGFGVRREVLNAQLDVGALARKISMPVDDLRDVLIGQRLARWDVYDRILHIVDSPPATRIQMKEIWARAHSIAIAELATSLEPPVYIAKTKEDFAELLRRVKAESGKSMAQIITRSGIPRSSAYAMIRTGDPTLPTRKDTVRRFLQAADASSTTIEEVLKAWAYLASRGPVVSTVESRHADDAPDHSTDESGNNPSPQGTAAPSKVILPNGDQPSLSSSPTMPRDAVPTSPPTDILPATPFRRDWMVLLALLLLLAFLGGVLGSIIVTHANPGAILGVSVLTGVIGLGAAAQFGACVALRRNIPARQHGHLAGPDGAPSS